VCRSGRYAACLALFASLLSACQRPVGAEPEQVHLSITDKNDEIVVWWMTDRQTETSTVRYGLNPDNLNLTATSNKIQQYKYRGIRMRGGYTSPYIHEVVVNGLRRDEYQIRYYYKCGDPSDGWSEVRSFLTRPEHPDVPVTFAALGDTDAGQDDLEDCRNLDRCVPATRTEDVMSMILQRTHNIVPTDLMLHVGDMSYADGNQDHWDSFGRLVQNTTSEVPIITAVGNHEFENRKTYDAWLYRWRHDEPNNGGDYWFSFDYGPVHFVFLTTEHDSRRQVDWLERDLGAADTPERRLRVPWIIVIAHHPMLNAGKYSMSGDNRDAFAPLFKRHRVTMYFCGHCHNYERTMPINADGITDTGAGTLQEPYIQEIHPASAVARVGSRLEAVPGYCNWSGCQDGRQGDPWCSEAATNCMVDCAGIWCRLEDEKEGENNDRRGRDDDDDGGYGRMADGWGTIHMIIGMGGRRGDQCPALAHTQSRPKAARGAAFFTVDRSTLHWKYIDTEGDIIDEMKICSRAGCAEAPPIDDLPPLPPAPRPLDNERRKLDNGSALEDGAEEVELPNYLENNELTFGAPAEQCPVTGVTINLSPPSAELQAQLSTQYGCHLESLDNNAYLTDAVDSGNTTRGGGGDQAPGTGASAEAQASTWESIVADAKALLSNPGFAVPVAIALALGIVLLIVVIMVVVRSCKAKPPAPPDADDGDKQTPVGEQPLSRVAERLQDAAAASSLQRHRSEGVDSFKVEDEALLSVSISSDV